MKNQPFVLSRRGRGVPAAAVDASRVVTNPKESYSVSVEPSSRDTKNMMRILGVDGGGSKTRVVVWDEAGGVLAVASGESSNLQSLGYELATRHLDETIGRALEEAKVRKADGACLGLAGVDREADRARMQAWAETRGYASKVQVVHDPELILAAGTPEGDGVALVCGTGSVAVARDRAGRRIRAGGWGHLVGDEGSGYAIAAEALRIAAQTADGRARAGALLAAILRRITGSDEDADAIIPFLYGEGASPKRVASLADVVLDLAERGEKYSAGIVSGQARAAATLVDALCGRLACDAPHIAMGGSLLTRRPTYAEAVRCAIASNIGPLTMVTDPTDGALRIGKRLLQDLR